jgi:hypothetical protein
MTLTQKKYLGFALGTLFAMLLAAPVLLGFATETNAAPLTGDELFGGKTATGKDFADDAGLGNANLIDTLTSIIRVALGFLGIIAVVIILLGGFKWMTSNGADAKVLEAKKLIFAGIVGLVIILSAYAIASFVITQITSVTNSTPAAPAAPAGGAT